MVCITEMLELASKNTWKYIWNVARAWSNKSFCPLEIMPTPVGIEKKPVLHSQVFFYPYKVDIPDHVGNDVKQRWYDYWNILCKSGSFIMVWFRIGSKVISNWTDISGTTSSTAFVIISFNISAIGQKGVVNVIRISTFFSLGENVTL